METIDYKTRKANKDHKCMLCDGIIKKDEEYDWSKHVSDGELYEWKSHKHCSFLASHYDMYDYCNDEGLDSRSFQEQINDIFDMSISEKALYLFNKILQEQKS